MTGGEDYRFKLLTRDSLDASVSAYPADPSQPVVLEIGGKRIDVAAAVLAYNWSSDELAIEDATPEWRRQALETAVLVATIGVTGSATQSLH